MLIEYAIQTDRGLRRANNEDAAVAGRDGTWFLVADGMGGHAAGEVASRLAASTVTEMLEEKDLPDSDPGLAMRSAAQEANARVFEMQQRRPECAGMGTTLSLLAFSGDRYYITHVGDSRAYLMRDGLLIQLTRDHSVVWPLFEDGILAKQDLSRHPSKNLITRSIGTNALAEVDFAEGEARERDVFLLCSDGLTDVVPDEAIRELLSDGGKSPRRLCADLVDAALAGGGPDNVTLVVVRLKAAPDPANSAPAIPA